MSPQDGEFWSWCPLPLFCLHKLYFSNWIWFSLLNILGGFVFSPQFMWGLGWVGTRLTQVWKECQLPNPPDFRKERKKRKLCSSGQCALFMANQRDLSAFLAKQEPKGWLGIVGDKMWGWGLGIAWRGWGKGLRAWVENSIFQEVDVLLR
jgi:hypothetical protein